MTALPLPPGLGDAFSLAAGELGFVSASWLFVREIAAEGGDAAVGELRDLLGRTYPILDEVAREWLAGARQPVPDATAVARICEGASRVVVVGLETLHLDALASALPREGVQRVLVEESPLSPEWTRVRANLGRQVEGASLSNFQRWAGRSSVLLTFGYGRHGSAAVYVPPAWLRVIGGDVRTQFRSIVLWNVLPVAPFVYPRWLADAPLDDFTDVV